MLYKSLIISTDMQENNICKKLYYLDLIHMKIMK